MSTFHVAGQVAWYAFLVVMAIGAVAEFRERNERLKHRPVNVGRRAARQAKQCRVGVVQETPAEVRKAYKAKMAKSQQPSLWEIAE